MTFRVAVGGLAHETNTYAVAVTGLTGLDRFDVRRDEAVVEAAAGSRTYIGGMLDAAEELGATVVPTMTAEAEPSGTIAREAYTALRDELVGRIAAAMPVDAVVLELHGAGVAEGVDDIEADIGRHVRGVIGDDVPLLATLDLHGNFSDDMADVFDVSLGVELYPHTDMYDRGHEAVSLLPRLLAGELHPVTVVEHLPMLLPTATTDPGNPAARMNEVCRAVEARPGILDCTVFHGFPYTDTPQVGVHVVVAADGDEGLARAAAREVGAWIWQHRGEFRSQLDGPDAAVRRAMQAEKRPVVVNDTADNSGGGAPGDGTHLLRAFLDAGVTNACFGFVCDPEVVAQAQRAGVGAVVDVRLGGKHGDLHGAPLEVRARVKCLTDGRYTLRGMGAGIRLDHGPMARLVIEGVDVLVSSKPSQTFDPEVFLLHGIDVTRYDIVGLKGSQHFRAGFRDVAAEIVTADSPGLTTQRVEVFEHPRAPGPMWPVDPDASYG